MTDPAAAAASAREILANLLRLSSFDFDAVESREEDGQCILSIRSSDPARIIGRMSQTLDAFQFLVNRIQSARHENAPYCLVDTGDYRVQRRKKLEEEALRGAETVRRTGRPWRMRPLNSLDRRVVHHFLRGEADLATESDIADRDGRKRVVIYPRRPGVPVPPAVPAEEPPAGPEPADAPAEAHPAGAGALADAIPLDGESAI
ncbi:MAG: hypothetical protein IJS32_00950 [Kiritimatiellae bacterium]|nr:hypothetical protein [Kiritimatiellia bacterium]